MDLTKIMEKTGVTVLILGLPGKGKTSSIRNFPADKTLILSSEPTGLAPLTQWGWEKAEVIVPKGVLEWQDAVKQTYNTAADHVVVDTLSSCHDLFLEEYINNKAAQGKAVHQLGLDMYRVANLQFQDILRHLFKLPELGKNLVLMVHLKYRQIKEGQQSKEPSLSENLSLWLARKCGLILRAEAVKQGPKVNYFLTASGNEGDYGSDKYGVTKEFEDNDLWAIISKISSKPGPKPEPKPKPVSTPKPTVNDSSSVTKEEAYKSFLDTAHSLKKQTGESIKWLTEQTGKSVLRLKAADIITAEKEFVKINWIE